MLLKRASQAVVHLVPFGAMLLLNRTLRIGTPESLARALRGHLEQLGGAFVPLGLALSLRRDVFPPVACDVLEQVGAALAPFDGNLAARTVESELGRPIDQLFASFDRSSLDATWDSQRHRASLNDSEPSIVSVRRPGMAAIASADLRIISVTLGIVDLAWLARSTYLSANMAGFREHVVDTLSMTTRGRLIDRLGAQTEANPHEYVPHVYWSHTSEGVLTLESPDGQPLGAVVGLPENPRASETESIDLRIDHAELARTLVNNSLKQIVEGEHFLSNVDLDALTVIGDDILAYSRLDLVNRMDTRLRRRLLAVVSALRSSDSDVVFDALVELIDPPGHADLRELESVITQRRADWRELTDPSQDAGAGRTLSPLVHQMLDDLRHRAIPVPQPILLFARTLATLERSALAVEPRFDMASELPVLFRALLTARIQRRFTLASLGELFVEYEELLMNPRQLLRTVSQSGRPDSAATASKVSSRLSVWWILRVVVTVAMVGMIAAWAWLQGDLQAARPVAAIASTPKVVAGLLMLALVRRVTTIVYGVSAARQR